MRHSKRRRAARIPNRETGYTQDKPAPAIPAISNDFGRVYSRMSLTPDVLIAKLCVCASIVRTFSATSSFRLHPAPPVRAKGVSDIRDGCPPNFGGAAFPNAQCQLAFRCLPLRTIRRWVIGNSVVCKLLIPVMTFEPFAPFSR